MASVRQVSVSSAEQLEQSISSYIAQGFAVMNRSPNSATMFKKKEFSVLWAIVGLLLCIIPLLIYLVVYAVESDQMVEIRVLQSRAALPPPNVQMSPDGKFWWDGRQWVAVPASEGPP